MTAPTSAGWRIRATRVARCGAFSGSLSSRACATSTPTKHATLIVWVARVARFPIAHVARTRTKNTSQQHATTRHLATTS